MDEDASLQDEEMPDSDSDGGPPAAPRTAYFASDQAQPVVASPAPPNLDGEAEQARAQRAAAAKAAQERFSAAASQVLMCAPQAEYAMTEYTSDQKCIVNAAFHPLKGCRKHTEAHVTHAKAEKLQSWTACFIQGGCRSHEPLFGYGRLTSALDVSTYPRNPVMLQGVLPTKEEMAERAQLAEARDKLVKLIVSSIMNYRVNSIPAAAACLHVLSTLVYNVLGHPLDPKMRQVR